MANAHQRAKRRATLNGILFVAFLFALLAVLGKETGRIAHVTGHPITPTMLLRRQEQSCLKHLLSGRNLP